MKLFDIHESKAVLREFDSDVKDAEFVKWVAASGKMREEVNELLRVTKKIILRLNRDKERNDKLYKAMKDMRKGQDDVLETIKQFSDYTREPDFLQDNPSFIELRKNMEEILKNLSEVQSGDGLEINPLITDLQARLGDIEARLPALEIGQEQTYETDSDQQGLLADVDGTFELL